MPVTGGQGWPSFPSGDLTSGTFACSNGPRARPPVIVERTSTRWRAGMTVRPSRPRPKSTLRARAVPDPPRTRRAPRRGRPAAAGPEGTRVPCPVPPRRRRPASHRWEKHMVNFCHQPRSSPLCLALLMRPASAASAVLRAAHFFFALPGRRGRPRCRSRPPINRGDAATVADTRPTPIEHRSRRKGLIYSTPTPSNGLARRARHVRRRLRPDIASVDLQTRCPTAQTSLPAGGEAVRGDGRKTSTTCPASVT